MLDRSTFFTFTGPPYPSNMVFKLVLNINDGWMDGWMTNDDNNVKW